LEIGDWRLLIGDWRLEIGDCKKIVFLRNSSLSILRKNLDFCEVMRNENYPSVQQKLDISPQVEKKGICEDY